MLVVWHLERFCFCWLPFLGRARRRAREIEARHHALPVTPDDGMLPLVGDSEASGKRDILEGRLIRVALRALQADQRRAGRRLLGTR